MLVAIVGATGTGKSEYSLDLAEALISGGRDAEIVNADAMQLYRGMDIGTAKLSPGERRGIPHHLIDVLSPSEESSVARYQSAARQAIGDIEARGAIPILVGGSGLYMSSVVYDFRFPGRDADVRSRLEADLAAEGPATLHERLKALDPAAAAGIGPHNGRRLVRALEVIDITGEPFGSGLSAEEHPWTETMTIGLRVPREDLVGRLNARVQRMWQAGIVEEVRRLGPDTFGATAARAIGYAQAIAQLRGMSSTDEAISETAALTRKYARRQVSWFKRYTNVRWIDDDDPDPLRFAGQLLLPYA